MLQRHGGRPPPAPSRVADRALGQQYVRAQVGSRCRCVRERHRRHEQLLEPWFGRRFDLDHVAGGRFHLGAQLGGQQRLDSAHAGCVPHRANRLERAVGQETEHLGVQWIDVRPERTSEMDLIQDGVTGAFEEQVDAGSERCLRELDELIPDLGVCSVARAHL